MVSRKIVTAAVLFSGVMLLGGCDMLEQFEQDKWMPQESNAISINEDGTITEIVQEELDASYYDAAELQNMITAEVQNYNKENRGSEEDAADPVTVKSYEVDDRKVTLKMEYASAQDYAQFNNVEFYYGSLINAQLEGYLFDVTYKKVQDGVVKNSSVSGTEVIKEMDEQVLIARAPLEIQVPGNVLYTSTNAEILAADVVNATGEQEKEEEEEGLVLPSNAVYRAAEEETTFAEAAAANRVYIIFEMD